MKLITWNINSVRLRLPLLRHLIKTERPDVVCLQETKCPDDLFPHEAIRNLGYTAHVSGMKSYNGVAILSRAPLRDARVYTRVDRNDCRHIAVKIDGVDVHCLYIPAGGDIPDRTMNPKFGHKLDFVDEITTWFPTQYSPRARVIVAGDLNIAPHEHDVWSHRALMDVVSHTPIEVDKLNAFQQSMKWVDVARAFVPMDQKCYTWWSYRNVDWVRSNRGRRLDHVWVTPALKSSLTRHKVITEARDWTRPSDHVPVVVEIGG